MVFFLTDTEKDQILSYNQKKGTADQFLIERLEQPVEQISIAFYYKGKTKRFDRQIFVYLNSAAWAGKLTRSKMHLQKIDSRLATREECIDDHLRSRMKWLIYNNWEDLIEDEFAETNDQLWVDQLHQYKSKFPLEKRPQKTEQLKLFHTL